MQNKVFTAQLMSLCNKAQKDYPNDKLITVEHVLYAMIVSDEYPFPDSVDTASLLTYLEEYLGKMARINAEKYINIPEPMFSQVLIDCAEQAQKTKATIDKEHGKDAIDIYTTFLLAITEVKCMAKYILEKHDVTADSLIELAHEKRASMVKMEKQFENMETEKMMTIMSYLTPYHFGCPIRNKQMAVEIKSRVEKLKYFLDIEQTPFDPRIHRMTFLTGSKGCGKTTLVKEYLYSKINRSKVDDISGYFLNIASLVTESYTMASVGKLLKDIFSYLNCANVVLVIENIELFDTKTTSISEVINAIAEIQSLSERSPVVLITCSDQTLKTIENKLIYPYNHMKFPEYTEDEIKKIIENNLYGGWVEYGDNAYHDLCEYSKKYMHGSSYLANTIELADAFQTYYQKHEHKFANRGMLNRVMKLVFGVTVDKGQDAEIYKNLKDTLKGIVKGQDEHIDKIVNLLYLSKAGLRDENKTGGNVFIRGVTGCGKTYFCQTLAKTLNIPLIRLDMTEYAESHTLAKLIGSPPGYLGYDSQDGSGSGLLFQEISKSPNCILLLDEIEKAHPKVQNLFLQAMDNGSIRNSAGITIDFSKVFLFMTSNVGAKEGNKYGSIGFGDIKTKASDNVFNDSFLPEFRGRLDLALAFNELDNKQLLKVIELEIKKLENTLAKQNITLVSTENDYKKILKKIDDTEAGARSIKRFIETTIKVKIAEMIILETSKKRKILLENLI